MADNYDVKILFRFYSDFLDEEKVETMWAKVVDEEKGFYKLDNIPFYAPVLACDDIVLAVFEEDEGMLTYKETIEYSGNSTIWVVMMDKSAEIDAIRDEFSNLGCSSEKMNDGYFAMDVPATAIYTNIKLKLEELEQQEIIGYAEGCLANGHRLQI